MRILVGYKTDNEQTRAYRIIKYEDGIFFAHTFMVMTRIDGSKYLGGGNIRKISGLKDIREEDIGEVEDGS